MALTLLDSLGDWNPQLLRELKGRLKAPNVLVAVAISLLGQLLTFLYFFSYLPNSTSRSAGSAYCTGGDPNITVVYQCLRDAAGNIIIDWPRWWLEPFVFLSLIGIFALIVVGPYLLITDLAQEQRRGTLNLIQLSPQPTDKILVGKLLGVPILLYLVAVLAAPLHLWAGLSAGIPLGQILSFYRKSFGGTTIRLEPDVAEMFPNADAVNEALRFLIRVMQQNQLSAIESQSNQKP